MEQAYKEIAPRLRGLRDALDLGTAQLAERLGVDRELVERYESGQVEIPVGYLLKVAQACDVDLTALITGKESRLTRYGVTRAGQGLSVERRKDYDYKALAATFTGRRMEPFMISVPPKGRDELHTTAHAGQEFIHMVSGEIEIQLGDDFVTLSPGDSIYFDSNTPHAMRATGGEPATFLDVIL